MPRKSYRAINGILLLDKPSGMSSNGALQHVRRLFEALKAGHTGSLDPLATGLLPVCLGEATKIAGLLLGSRKAYQASARLGVTTTTADADGEMLEQRPVPPLTDADIEAAMAAFRGHIVQVPPVYSAIKQGGVPLYKRARRGEEVTVPAREVDVFRFDLVGRKDDDLQFEITCGSGTYVRSLVTDLGEALGCGAHLTALRRTWVDPFRAPEMITLDALAQLADSGGLRALDALLLPVDAGLQDMPAIELDATAAAAVEQGRRVQVDAPQGLYRAYGNGRLLALATVDADGCLRVKRGFNDV